VGPSFSRLTDIPFSAVLLLQGQLIPLETRPGCPEDAFCIDTGMYFMFHDELSARDISLLFSY
jgi:hypothetical protein